MKLSDFDYPLPKELIAQVPLEKRDESRLMTVDRVKDDIGIGRFKDIAGLLNKDDLLVVNNTRVFPARLFGKKNTGGKIELLLIKKVSRENAKYPVFTSLCKSSKPLKQGQELFFSGGLTAEVVSGLEDGRVKIRFFSDRDIFKVLEEIGLMPLPPYIKRDGNEKAEKDKVNYQTVYAENTGAVAAPTAGLHFTDELLKKIEKRGVKVNKLTLHVGLGTFLPVRSDNILEHKMHEEYFCLDEECIKEVTEAKENGKRVIAVGTTSLRALESAFTKDKRLMKREGNTSLFIYPGYKFKIVDALITNFHLPKSTLFMLVCAFGGTDLMKRAYLKAVEESFRFFSYGDAMYIS